jgi:hypothetical protein
MIDGTWEMQYPPRTNDNFDVEYFFNKHAGKRPLPKEIEYLEYYRVEKNVILDIQTAIETEQVCIFALTLHHNKITTHLIYCIISFIDTFQRCMATYSIRRRQRNR